MAKRKDSIALFEVIKNRRSDANLDVPGWMGAKGSAGQQEPPELPPAQPTAPPKAAPKAWSRIVSGAGGQLSFKLNYTHCILAAAALVLVLIAAVWIGFALGDGSATTPPDTGPMAGAVPPGQHVLGGPGAGSSRAKPSEIARVKGKYYLVVQALNGVEQKDLAEAGRIATWCKARGEPVTVVKFTHPTSRRKRYMVWSLRPFDSFNGEAPEAFARKIEGLGKKYLSEFRTYDFRQRRASGKFDPWYLPQP